MAPRAALLLAVATAASAANSTLSCTFRSPVAGTLLVGVYRGAGDTSQLDSQLWAAGSPRGSHPTVQVGDEVTFLADSEVACGQSPSPPCSLRVFAGSAPKYVWRGAVGNTGQQSGFSVYLGMSGPVDIAIAGGVGVYTHGYTEQTSPLAQMAVPAADTPQTFGHSDYHRMLSLVAFDGEVAYFANTGLFVPESSFFYIPSTFVVGYDVGATGAATCEHNFTLGGRSVCEQGTNQSKCVPSWDGCNAGVNSGFYSSVIDYAHTPGESAANGTAFPDAATGIAVQRSPGVFLVVAHGYRADDTLRVFHKKTGAGLCNYSLPGGAAPQAIAFAPDGASLWVVDGGGGIARYALPAACPAGTGAAASVAPPLTPLVTLPPGAVAAPGGIAVGRTSGRLFVVDVASSQVRVFDGATGAPAGPPLFTAGGYADGNTTVDASRIWLFPASGAGPWPGRGSFLAVDDDAGEGLWVSDWGNRRVLRVATQGPARGALMPDGAGLGYLSAFYRSTVHSATPSRVFANFLELAVDYGAPDLGRGGWRLVRNWAAGLDAGYGATGQSSWAGFQQVGAALGLTVGTVQHWANTTDWSGQYTLAVLLDDAAQPPSLRVLHNFSGATVTPWLHADGAMRSVESVSDPASGGHWQRIWEAPLVANASGGGAPGWELPGRVIAAFNTSANASEGFAARQGGVGARFPVAGGRVLLMDATTQRHGGDHLGAVPVNGSALAWTACPWGTWDLVQGWTELVDPGSGLPANVTTYSIANMDGRYGADNPGINYAAGYPVALGGSVLFAFFGEGWDGWEANQHLHFTTDGLFVGQFGTPNFPTYNGKETRHYVLEGSAGNSFAPSLVADPATGGTFWLHNDENQHGGVHVWQLMGGVDFQEVVPGVDAVCL